MRIVGGKHSGRRLMMVGKSTSRATADMVKEAVFNMLGGTISGVALDLFAGNGAYGLEALSRGAHFAYMIDHDKDAISTIIQNTALIGEEKRASIQHKDYLRFLAGLGAEDLFDYVFLDPPYNMNVCHDVMRHLGPYLAKDGVIVCEMRRENNLPEEMGIFKKAKERYYGSKRVILYQRKQDL